ncbi:MAG: hypothetical protein K9L86_00645 [Candidatus Omnitrophica bacterium]|nr:hypothetical protein [Candidatus Omnitrophota bacterium]
MKKLFLTIIIFGLLFLISSYLEAAISYRSSKVFFEGKQLLVAKPDSQGRYSQASPFIIKGVTWSPETAAPDFGPNPICPNETVEYGFFFDWAGRIPQGHEIFVYWKERQFVKHYLTDVPLMRKMNLNTVRVYSSFGDDFREGRKVLDELFDNGIMIIMNVAMSKVDIDNQKYLKVVEAYKDHPAILFWAIGNEWNLDYNKYWGYETVEAAAQATNQVAKAIKQVDPDHPVTSVLGDRFSDCDFEDSVSHILDICLEIDVWGFNVYRGKSFRDFFSQVESLTERPFYISEFGTDSFRTTKFKVVDEHQADNCKGWEHEALQAKFVLGLWREIESNLSGIHSDKQCLGGLVHEFNDSLWKVGSYHVGLGGLVDYYSEERSSFRTYNTEGFYLPGGHPDDVANEEYFGIVNAERKPKEIFFKLQEYYAKLK